MGKSLSRGFFFAVSFVCFSLGSGPLQAACSLVDDTGGAGTGTTLLNDDIAGYNASSQTCTSPIQFDGNITLNADVSSVTSTGTLLFNSNSSTSYTITGTGGSGYVALQTATSGANLQLGSYLAIENAPVSIGPGSLQFNASQNWAGSQYGITQINLGSGGTIEFNTSGTIASPFVLTGDTNCSSTNPVHIQVNSGSTIVSTGVISGTGALTKLGSGTLTLIGSNTYTGGTIVAEGTLRLGNNQAAGPSSISQLQSLSCGPDTIKMNANTTLVLDDGISNAYCIPTYSNVTIVVESGTATLSGVISVYGFRKTGGGTLVLSGTNNYYGGNYGSSTILSAGTIALANSTGLGAGTLTMDTGTTLVLNNGIKVSNSITLSGCDTISVASGGTATLSGVISSTGSLVCAGPGTLILAGINTYSGGTTLSGGTLQLANSTGLGVGTLTMNTGTTLALSNTVSVANAIVLSGSSSVFAAAGTSTLSGQMTGSSLLSTGGASGTTLNLAGDASGFSGGIAVSSATTVIPTGVNFGTSAISPGPLSVGTATSSLGTLTANGTIDCSTFNNYGTVNGSGIITADGTVVYDDGVVAPGSSPGTLTFISPITFQSGSTLSIYIDPSDFANLEVDGDITLENGATLQFRPETGCYANGQRYEFLTFSGSLSGRFSSIDMGTLLLTPTISYGEDNATLIVHRTNLTTVVQGANSLAVARVLEPLIASNANPSFCSAVGKLILASQEEISSVFNELQPSQGKALVISQENNAVKVRDTLSYRMQTVLDSKHCMSVFAKQEGEDSTKAASCSNEQRPFHVWVNGMGDALHQDSSYFAGSSQVGYQENMAGVVAGLDYHFAKYLYAGALGAYTDSDLKWQNHQGTGGIQSGYAGIYFSALGKLFYGNASVIGSWNSFDAHRNINFPLETVTAKNDHGGVQLLSHIDTGVNFGWRGFTIRPFDSFDYITGTENSYTESGAGDLDLAVEKSNSIFLRNELGLNFSGCFCMTYGTWMLSPKISWVREMRIKGSEYTAEFVGTDLPFEVTGYFPDRSLVSPGVSLTGSFMDDLLTVGIYYNGEFKGNYSDHSYGGQVRFGF